MNAAALVSLVSLALALAACERAPSPMVATNPAPTPVGAAASDTSVPPADSVLVPAVAAKADPAAGRSNKSMSRTQETGAMPMPGQNNDHSAPLTPDKPASGP